MTMKTLTDYGAIGDGVADDTLAIQAALDGETALGIPANIYRITQPIVQRKAMRVEGAGGLSRIIADFATPQAGAWIVDIRNSPPLGSSLEGFSIEAPCPAIRLDLSVGGTTNYLNRWSLRKLMLSNTAGGYALDLHNPVNGDGFFCSTISDSYFNGGLFLPRCGDSVNIERNTITGPGPGIYMTAVQGANKCVIRDNNITAQGIAISCGQYMLGTKIEGNNIEQVAGNSDYCILVSDGASKPTIVDNGINGHGRVAGSLIGMANVSKGVIDNNDLNGCATGIYITPSSSAIHIGKRNTGNCAALLVNQGTGTIIE